MFKNNKKNVKPGLMIFYPWIEKKSDVEREQHPRIPKSPWEKLGSTA